MAIPYSCGGPFTLVGADLVGDPAAAGHFAASTHRR